MHVFRDSKGDTWELAITLGAVKRVLAHAGVDLRSPAAPYPADPPAGVEPVALCAALELDALLLAGVVWALCYSQASERGVSEEVFLDRIGPEVFEAMHHAFFEEWVFFCRQLKNAPLAAILQKQIEFTKRATAKASEAWEISGAKAALNRLVEQEMETLEKRLTNSLESAAAIPTPSLSEAS